MCEATRTLLWNISTVVGSERTSTSSWTRLWERCRSWNRTRHGNRYLREHATTGSYRTAQPVTAARLDGPPLETHLPAIHRACERAAHSAAPEAAGWPDSLHR